MWEAHIDSTSPYGLDGWFESRIVLVRADGIISCCGIEEASPREEEGGNEADSGAAWEYWGVRSDMHLDFFVQVRF